MSRSVKQDYDKLRAAQAEGKAIIHAPEGPDIRLGNISIYASPEVIAHYGEDFLRKLNDMKMPKLIERETP